MAEELTKRVEKLEKENRVLKVIFFLVLFMLSAALFMGAAKWNKEITTESLKIVDKKGNTGIELFADVEGAETPAIAFYDSEEETRLMIAFAEDETPMIGLYDSKGEKVLGMGVPENVTPGIYFFNSEWKTKLTIGIVENGTPGIVFCDSDGKTRLATTISDDGIPTLKFYEPDGEVIRSLP